MTDLNPQARQMADESMVRTLDAQARAIWPQEVDLIRRYGLADDIHILDAGCGTGEGTVRLAELFPRANVLAVDVLEGSLELARERHGHIGSRVRFEKQSVFELPAASGAFDLTACRHVVHSIPDVPRVYAELKRVTRRGGRLHLIPEDYGMLHFERGPVDPREFWHEVPANFGRATETDLFVGRHSYRLLDALGLADIRVDYVIVDTIRVPRETFAAIIGAWRDGYTDLSVEHSQFSRDEVVAHFDAMIANILDPHGYAAWMVPVVSARVP